MKKIDVQFKDITMKFDVCETPKDVSYDILVQVFDEDYTFDDIVTTLTENGTLLKTYPIYTLIIEGEDENAGNDYTGDLALANTLLYNDAEWLFLDGDNNFIFEYDRKIYLYKDSVD